MGGFVAIELARRGRAETVCALSPGGFWSSGDGLRKRMMAKATNSAGLARLTRPIAPFPLKSATMRRLWFRGAAAAHGDRVTARRAVEIIDDYLACTVYDEIFSTDAEQIAPLDPLPCPITVAWSEKDAMLPVASYGPNARERLPQATFEILPDVGHDPMMDDPALVARTILACTGAAEN
jgi:pimeloyl-ACP methyl ester carboxylesterase